MTIFGFNTDVRCGDTVYHVQTEARQHEHLLQTQVFVRGRCIGKRTTTYADRLSEPDFSESLIHELLKEQHRNTVDAAREGRVMDVIEQPLGRPALALEWVNAGDAYAGENVVIRLLVTDSGTAVSGARVWSRVSGPDGAPLYADSTTDVSGQAEMRFPVDRSALSGAAILVQASYAGTLATKKFKLRR
jgi:hypothetical protein